jgi:hypothetical protein
MNFKIYHINPLILFITVLLLFSCNYSFTGASISPDVKTISVARFNNQAAIVNPTLSQNFTDALKDKFTSQTNLILKDKNGDLYVEGVITDYSTQPIALQGASSNGIDRAALNRLSITVSVKFINKINEKQNFETSFTRFQDYPSSKNLREVEDNLVKQINSDLVEDIFNKAVVNW